METFVFLGTQIPAINQIPNTFSTTGRNRLHGAFQGGFSAGYHNTVGSKNGFTPSQFISSRHSKTTLSASNRPEDYMDDEDLQAHFKASIVTSQEYSAAPNIPKLIFPSHELSHSILKDLIVSSNDLIGSRLLKQMGWRHGQGVGPRTKRFTDSTDIHAQIHTFAPKNTAMLFLNNKIDTFGLGFDALKNAPEFKNKNSKPIVQNVAAFGISSNNSKAGFGVGVFEEEDEDIYGFNDRAQYSQTIDDDEERWLKSNQKTTLPETPKIPTKMFNQKSTRLCHDGRPPLLGFELSNETMPEPKWFTPPIVPDDFNPIHIFEADDVVPSRISNKALDPDQRRDILGEESLQGPARATIQDQLAQNILPKIPTLDKNVAMSALKGFMPFGTDLKKQSRYKLYLQVMAEQSEESLTSIPESELNEFSKAGQMFRPLSNLMASRFAPAANPDIAPLPSIDVIHTVMEKPDNKPAIDSNGISRSKSEWRPDKLLCKRFDVPNPYPDAQSKNEQEKLAESLKKEILNEEKMNELKMERDKMIYQNPLNSSIHETEMLKRDSFSDSLQAENNINDMPEIYIQKPSMDLFKSIFADSDEEENDNAQSETVKETPVLNPDISISKKPNPLFRPVFRKKKDREKEIDDLNIPLNITKVAPGILPPPASNHNSLVEDKSILIDNSHMEKQIQITKPDADILNEMSLIDKYAPAIISNVCDQGSVSRRPERDDETTHSQKKIKRRKKKRNRNDSQRDLDEWVEISPTNTSKSSRPTASDFM